MPKLAYADPGYLESLSEFGTLVWGAKSGSGWLSRNIPGTPLADLAAPYPLLQCTDWLELESELGAMGESRVSAVAVADPLTAPESITLRQIFPDLCRPYKEHYLVTLDRGYEGPYADGHRRNLERARKSVRFETSPPSSDALMDWIRLYSDLIDRHGIAGVAAFSPRSFAKLFSVGGLRIDRAIHHGQTVAMALWLVAGNRAYYHLGAANAEGYRLRANFGLFDQALQSFAENGIEHVLLGAGAGVFGDLNDGLSRFKSGWSNETRTAYLCGRIFDPAAYSRLGGNSESGFFPAYRDPAAATAAGEGSRSGTAAPA